MDAHFGTGKKERKKIYIRTTCFVNAKQHFPVYSRCHISRQNDEIIGFIMLGVVFKFFTSSTSNKKFIMNWMLFFFLYFQLLLISNRSL